jgi:hypothetical protein
MGNRKKRSNTNKKGKENRLPKKEKEIVLPVEDRIYTRRGFVAASALAGITLLMKGHNRDPYVGEWEFLKQRPPRYPSFTRDIINNEFVKLGQRNQINENSPYLARLKKLVPDSLVNSIIKRSNWDPKGDYSITPLEGKSAISDSQKYYNQVLDYCKKTIKFSHSKISGLTHHPIKWTRIENPVTPEDTSSYVSDAHQRGFIGNRYILDFEIGVTNKAHPEQSVYAPIYHISQSGAFVYLKKSKDDDTLGDWYFFIPTDRFALVAPFSEIIPLSTFSSLEDYKNKVGRYTALVADETFAEGLSYVLSSELANDLNIPNGFEIITGIQNRLKNDPRYQFVPQSITWIQKNGVQNAFDLYSESAEKYMTALGINLEKELTSPQER